MRRLFLIAIVALAPLALAHDFWVEPSTFRPKVGDDVRIALRQGEQFVGDPVPRDPSRIDRFIVRDANGERAIDGITGRDPAGTFAVTAPGRAIVAYRTKPKVNEPQDAAKFEQYLREEGLERIIEVRKKRGESTRKGYEMFSRSAKALLFTGVAKGPRFDAPVGFRYEIVPETDPYATTTDTFTFRLLFDGKPLQGALLTALPYDAPIESVQARSGRDGRATLRLPRRGVWLVKSIHMVPAPPTAGVEWESIWASVTFQR